MLCETNPISRGRGGARAGKGVGATTGAGCTNKPNLPGTGWERGWPGGREALPALGTIVRNKPNLLRSDLTYKYLMDKELRPIGRANGLGKTKPICAWAARGRGRQGHRCWRWDRLYKQTQFAPGSGFRDQRSASCPPAPGTPAAARCTNKPNLPPWTETGAGRRSRQRGCRVGPLHQTNPICPAPAGEGAGRVGAKRCRRWGQTCETNPIRPERQEGQALCGKRVMTNWCCPWLGQNKANLRSRAGVMALEETIASGARQSATVRRSPIGLTGWDQCGINGRMVQPTEPHSPDVRSSSEAV